MTKLKAMLSSPKRIALFAVCVVVIVAVLAFTAIKVGASVLNNQGIGLDQATQVALQNAGFSESEVTLLRGHFDRDDGISTYDIEFRGSDGFDYDYVVSANDGTIIEATREMAELLAGTQGTQNTTGQQTQENQQNADSGKTETGNSTDKNAATSGNNSSSSSSSSSKPAANSSSGSTQSQSGLIGLDKAKSIALENAGLKSSQVTFRHAYQDYDDGIYVYEIEFVSNGLEYNYEIHGTTGRILDKDIDGDDDYYKNSASQGQNTANLIGIEKAKSLAAADAGFSTSKVEFIRAQQDYDDGMYVYDIEFINGETKYEYEIRATDGMIIDRDRDWIYD